MGLLIHSILALRAIGSAPIQCPIQISFKVLRQTIQAVN
jgi:hypothetical protein